MQKKNYNFLRNIGLEAYYREVDRDKAQKINGNLVYAASKTWKRWNGGIVPIRL